MQRRHLVNGIVYLLFCLGFPITLLLNCSGNLLFHTNIKADYVNDLSLFFLLLLSFYSPNFFFISKTNPSVLLIIAKKIRWTFYTVESTRTKERKPIFLDSTKAFKVWKATSWKLLLKMSVAKYLNVYLFKCPKITIDFATWFELLEFSLKLFESRGSSTYTGFTWAIKITATYSISALIVRKFSKRLGGSKTVLTYSKKKSFQYSW